MFIHVWFFSANQTSCPSPRGDGSAPPPWALPEGKVAISSGRHTKWLGWLGWIGLGWVGLGWVGWWVGWLVGWLAGCCHNSKELYHVSFIFINCDGVELSTLWIYHTYSEHSCNQINVWLTNWWTEPNKSWSPCSDCLPSADPGAFRGQQKSGVSREPFEGKHTCSTFQDDIHDM